MASILHGLEGSVHRTNQSFDENKELLTKQQLVLRGWQKDWTGPWQQALSLLAGNQFKECPNLVWVTPIAVEEKDQNWDQKRSEANIQGGLCLCTLA